MPRPLRVLIAEDRPEDAELVIRELRRAGFDPEWQRVDTEEDFVAYLDPRLDVILSDYSMPQFSGLRALSLLNERALEIPFILVSGTIGGDTAVAAIKQGAADYLIKDRLTRLGPAVEQALAQARLRQERQQASDALQLFRTLVDESNDTFEVIDPETGRFLDVNAKGCSDLGFTREEYLSLRVCDLDPTIPSSAWFQIADEIRTKGTRSGEGRHVRKDGSSFPIEFSAKWVRLDRDYIVAVVRDITARQRAEERVREQAALLDHAHDAILVRGFEDRRISFWNKGAENLYGWTVEEAIGKDVSELVFVDPFVVTHLIHEGLLQDGEWRGETRHKTKAGKELTMNTRATLVRNAAGHPKSVLSINTDITQQKELEGRFLRAQRMESIGTLASGVAHDLNNILSPIMMSVAILRHEMGAQQREDILSTIEASAERGAQIVKQVLTFGRGLDGERRPLKAEALITEVMKIMRGTFPKDLVLESALEPRLWPVIGDATQLHQVLLNLCVNGRDAMPGGGKLRLRATNIEIDASYADTLTDATPGRFLLLEVSDTGAGIPPHILDRIFEPFFTTKTIGTGTGLGLSTVLGIVKSHGGFLKVNTQPGKGSTFQVYLPAIAGEESASANAVPTSPPRGNGELILIVDDEPSVRSVARISLERGGYRVLLAGDGTEAMTVFASNSGSISAVLTDLMMPQMDGVTLIRALRSFAPDLPIIASSGLGEKTNSADALKAMNVKTTLQKPYSVDALLRSIRQVLHPV